MTSPNKTPSKRLFVGSLPYRFTEGELLTLFVPFGRIISLKIAHNQWGKSRGLGFVEFDNIASAIAAKNKLHNHQLEDRSIIVDFAQPDPALTPEGQERHLQALKRKPQRRLRNVDLSKNPENKPRDFKFFNQPFKGKKPKHLRQSVYDARRHGARVGRKFASKSPRLKKPN